MSLAQQVLGAGIAEHAQAGRIGEGAAPIAVDAEDAFAGELQQQAQPLLAVARRLLGRLDLGVMQRNLRRHGVEGVGQFGELALEAADPPVVIAAADGAHAGRQRRQRPPHVAADQETDAQERQHKPRQMRPQLVRQGGQRLGLDVAGRHLDRQDAAQFARRVAVAFGIAAADHLGRGLRAAMAVQAAFLDADRPGIEIVRLARRGLERQHQLLQRRFGAEAGDRLHLDGIGAVARIARPVGDVVEGDAARVPVAEIGGDRRKGVRRQQRQRLVGPVHTAGHQLALIDPPRRHHHGADLVGLVLEIAQGQVMGAAIGEGGVADEHRRQNGADDQQQPGLELHSRPPGSDHQRS